MVLGFEPRALCMRDKCSTTKLHSLPFLFFIVTQGLVKSTRLARNLGFFLPQPSEYLELQVCVNVLSFNLIS